MTSPIGPAGDTLYLPLRITGGAVTGFGHKTVVLGGMDVTLIHADEILTHCGRFVTHDAGGNILFSYQGTSVAPEGTYDNVLDLRVPGQIPSRLIVHAVSTNPLWRLNNRQPLVAAGSFNAAQGVLEFVLHTLPKVTCAPRRLQFAIGRGRDVVNNRRCVDSGPT